MVVKDGGGGGGIRTHGRLRDNGFQDRHLRPLGHPSGITFSNKTVSSEIPRSVKHAISETVSCRRTPLDCKVTGRSLATIECYAEKLSEFLWLIKPESSFEVDPIVRTG